MATSTTLLIFKFLQGFYINLVVGAVFAPIYAFLFPPIDPQPGKTITEKCKMIDWAMTLVFLAGSACLITGISFGGVVYSWSSSIEIALWTVSGALLIISVILLRFHLGVSMNNALYPTHFLRQPMLMNMQLQVFLSSGIILVY